MSGCASAPLFSAPDDVHRFLIAVRDNDQAAFEALVHEQVSTAGDRCYNEGLRGPAFMECYRLGITSPDVLPPSAFRGIAASFGYRAGRSGSGPVGIPLKSVSHDQVCVRAQHHGDCLLFFARHGKGWRLIGVTDPTRLEGL